MKKAGFTLAEVLITLAVIGVVAALTIPTVVNNYQKTQTVTKLKKAYSALSNTANLAIAEHGPITEWDMAHNNGAKDFVEKYLIPYLKVSKNCGIETTGICKFDWSNLNRLSSGSFNNNYARFYLNDGTLIALLAYNTTLSQENGVKLGYVYIDINGQKKPNMFGKDIFSFTYYVYNSNQNNPLNGKFIPKGLESSTANLINDEEHGCNKNADGIFCAALIMKQGWQIKDDYPW